MVRLTVGGRDAAPDDMIYTATPAWDAVPPRRVLPAYTYDTWETGSLEEDSERENRCTQSLACLCGLTFLLLTAGFAVAFGKLYPSSSPKSLSLLTMVTFSLASNLFAVYLAHLPVRYISSINAVQANVVCFVLSLAVTLTSFAAHTSCVRNHSAYLWGAAFGATAIGLLIAATVKCIRERSLRRWYSKLQRNVYHYDEIADDVSDRSQWSSLAVALSACATKYFAWVCCLTALLAVTLLVVYWFHTLHGWCDLNHAQYIALVMGANLWCTSVTAQMRLVSGHTAWDLHISFGIGIGLWCVGWWSNGFGTYVWAKLGLMCGKLAAASLSAFVFTVVVLLPQCLGLTVSTPHRLLAADDEADDDAL